MYRPGAILLNEEMIRPSQYPEPSPLAPIGTPGVTGNPVGHTALAHTPSCDFHIVVHLSSIMWVWPPGWREVGFVNVDAVGKMRLIMK